MEILIGRIVKVTVLNKIWTGSLKTACREKEAHVESKTKGRFLTTSVISIFIKMIPACENVDCGGGPLHSLLLPLEHCLGENHHDNGKRGLIENFKRQEILAIFCHNFRNQNIKLLWNEPN